MTDLLSHGPDDPHRKPARWLVAVCAAVVIVVASLIVIGTRGDDQRTPAAGPPATSHRPAASVVPLPSASPRPTVGLLIDRRVAPGGVVERRDRKAGTGPWTVVLRRPDGALGSRGAVLTFPVEAASAGRPVQVGGATGKAGDHVLTWPVAGRHARVRGDLPSALLTAVARGTTVSGGRPAVDAPAGLAVLSTGPYRSAQVNEVRYAASDLPHTGGLGGLIYTGVVSGGGFEDRLYAAHPTGAGRVHGRPAVVSEVAGGNGTIAWEPGAPGLVAYVGYSGGVLNEAMTADLRAIARRTHPIGARQWQELHPQVVYQSDDLD